MKDFDDSPETTTKGGHKYRSAFGCHNKARAEEEVARYKRDGIKAIVVPCLSYRVYREVSHKTKWT